MNEIKVAQSGLTFAAPLRVLLGKESGDQEGLPFANCALYAVIPDRNQPFTELEIHYNGGMKNAFDGDETQLIDGVVEFSVSELVKAYNANNLKKIRDVLPQFLNNVAVTVQKRILWEMNKADFLTDQEYDAYSNWIKVYAIPLDMLEVPDDYPDEQNYICGSYNVGITAHQLVERILKETFLNQSK